MIELNKSLWHPDFNGAWRVIPINCQIDSKSNLIMGAGLAKEAKERYPHLPAELGKLFTFKKPEVTMLEDVAIIAFPTKYFWREKSDIHLIESGLSKLKAWCDVHDDVSWKIVSPRLGCGLDKLDWETDVKPLMQKYFENDPNFIVAYQS